MWATLSHLPAELRRRTTAGSSYRPEIDGLRFFAIMFVIMGHMCERIERFQTPISQPGTAEANLFFYLAQPGSGVYLFFAISGFIIANQYLRKKPMPFDGTYLKNYFLRRLLRIEPPYFILLIATYLLISATGYVPDGVNRFNTQPESLTTSLFASLFYVHSPIYGTFPRLFPPGWSLEMEVQFYLLAPLFFCILYFMKNSMLRKLVELALLAVGFWLAAYWSTPANAMAAAPHYENTILLFFIFFWIGTMMASDQDAISKIVGRLPLPIMQVLPWAGALAIFWGETLAVNGHGTAFFVQLVGICLTFAGVLDNRTSFKRFCSLPWISLLGGACYSIYLVHLQILQVASKILITHLHQQNWFLVLAVCCAVLIPLVLACGMIFYTVVERSFMIPDWHIRFWNIIKSKIIRAAL
jgi:peptidoglycan/LPS O-acetylase OafA/YrhL